MSLSRPEQADLLDDSAPGQDAFRSGGFAIGAQRGVAEVGSDAQAGVAEVGDGSPPSSAGEQQSPPCTFKHIAVDSCLLPLRHRRPWEWPAGLQMLAWGALCLAVFGLLGSLPTAMGIVNSKQMPTSEDGPVFEAVFERVWVDFSFNTYTPSPSTAYFALSRGVMAFSIIILMVL